MIKYCKFLIFKYSKKHCHYTNLWMSMKLKKKRNQFGIVFSNNEDMNNLIIDGFMSNLMIKVETNRFYGILRPP